ncbi:MAG: right-handed parallel beta-helix repeat-containing protein [Planctomycetota bacterium]
MPGNKHRLYLLAASALLVIVASTLDQMLPLKASAQTLTFPPKPTDPRAPIGSLPYTITSPGSYYFLGNLDGTSGASGITVDADDVTIDMNGFRMQGVVGSLDGITTTTTPRNITIVNGAIGGWGQSGVDLVAAHTISLDRLKSTGNAVSGFRLGSEATLTKCTAEQNGNIGFFFIDDANSVLASDCIAVSNTGDGFHSVSTGSVPEPAKAGSFTRCIAKGNTGDGYELAGYELDGCAASENTLFGFVLIASEAQGCTARSNQQGFHASVGTQIRESSTKNNLVGIAARIDDSTLIDSSLYETRGNGATVIMGSGSTVRGCHVVQRNSGNSATIAVASGATNCLVAGNEIRGNGLSHAVYLNPTVSACTVIQNRIEFTIRNDAGLSNHVAPTESATTSVNPWANLQF